jgi:hypothetical protein
MPNDIRDGSTWSAPNQPATPSWLNQKSGGPSWGNQGPGIQPGQAQSHLSSVNTSGPGAGESYYNANSNVWQAPSFGEVNNQGLVGKYSNPGARPATTDNSGAWNNQFQGAMPSISSEPGFGSYFDNAKNRAAESINQAMAARGAYGSSAANDQTARAFTDLDGQQALKEADYNLQRLGEQRGWQSLGGQLAGQADTNSLNNANNERQWTQLLSQLGLDASQLGLSRTNAGMDAALAAQGAQRTRGQDYFNNQMSMGDRMADLYKSTILPALDNDAAMMEQASSGGVAAGNQAANNERTNANDTLGYANTAASLYNSFYG